MKWLPPISVVLAGILYHALFFSYNTILTESDSFAYIRMAEGILRLSSDGLGTGWFGFIYSVFLAFFLPFFNSDILAGQFANMLLLIISSVLFYHIARKIFSLNWSTFALALFLFHPSFLYYRIHLLAENIYIPIFLGIILGVWTYISVLIENKNLEGKNILLRENNSVKSTYMFPVLLGVLLGLLYLTRAEGFIYMGSVGIIAVYLLCKKYFNVKTFFASSGIFFLSFFLFISPYLFHLHSLTGEWGLTNKGASNWRQAELRGQTHMDDLGFEEAVAGLTSDNSGLIAGFAGGMPYFRPQIEGGFRDDFLENYSIHLSRMKENQVKLYTQNLPEIYLGNSYKLARSDDSRFTSIFFQLFLMLLSVPMIAGILLSYKKYSQLLGVFIAFFIPASIFFTLFFTLNRYFIIFLPFLLLFTTLGVQFAANYLSQKYTYISYIIVVIFVVLFAANTALSNFNFLSLEREKNNFYALKKEAGEWISDQSDNSSELKILERFPFVTYYSGVKWRYITPYTEDIADIVDYMRFKSIDYLIIDSMDFYTYRPALREYLENIPEGFQLAAEFTNSENQKVRILRLEDF